MKRGVTGEQYCRDKNKLGLENEQTVEETENGRTKLPGIMVGRVGVEPTAR